MNLPLNYFVVSYIDFYFDYRVVAEMDGQYVPVPINIDSVNILLNQTITDKYQMKRWLKKNQVHNDNPQNGEEAALSRVGKELYEQIFKNYTYKQWSKYPKELDASVLLRIPVSESFDDRYFPYDPYQALPTNGYTTFIKNMLTHRNIHVSLEIDYFELKPVLSFTPKVTIYTGPIDHYFRYSGLPKLEYRSIHFESITLYNTSFFQPCSVVNHPKGPEKYTRIVEYKHFLAQRSDHTTIVKDFSSDTGDPFYPVPNKKNRHLYSKYKQLAQNEKTENVQFVGRLANYKYFNMDEAILNALTMFESMYKMHLPPFEVRKQPITKSTSLTIVISHCKESLAWLRNKRDIFQKYATKIVIYDKCNTSTDVINIRNELENVDAMFQYNLPNVGREGHTWIDFILSKQSLFSDVNLFIQANPHQKDQLAKKMNDFQNEVARGVQYLPLFSYGCQRLENSVSPKVYPHYLDANLSCFWVKRFIKTNTCKVKTSFTGEFLVSETGLRRVLGIYRSVLMEMYRGLSEENNPVLGHILERLWTTIFTMKGC